MLRIVCNTERGKSYLSTHGLTPRLTRIRNDYPHETRDTNVTGCSSLSHRPKFSRRYKRTPGRRQDVREDGCHFNAVDNSEQQAGSGTGDTTTFIHAFIPRFRQLRRIEAARGSQCFGLPGRGNNPQRSVVSGQW